MQGVFGGVGLTCTYKESILFRVTSLNANGIRAAARKGFFEWMRAKKPDVVCIQETKAQLHQLTDECFSPAGYHCYYEDAQKKGYSGVAIYCRQKPQKVIRGLGIKEFDDEGRYLEVRLGAINVVSLYLPSGSSGDIRQAVKFRFLDSFTPHLRKLMRRRSEYVLCGDWNIAHKAIDLKNWRANQKNSGFLPEEREWMEELFSTERYVDAFRTVNEEPDQYTWWSNRGRAWDNNVGWRLDYQVVTPGLRDKILRADIYKENRFSDHAPLTLDYDWSNDG
jgi:exodeoxyribonuclease-3